MTPKSRKTARGIGVEGRVVIEAEADTANEGVIHREDTAVDRRARSQTVGVNHIIGITPQAHRCLVLLLVLVLNSEKIKQTTLGLP